MITTELITRRPCSRQKKGSQTLDKSVSEITDPLTKVADYISLVFKGSQTLDKSQIEITDPLTKVADYISFQPKKDQQPSGHLGGFGLFDEILFFNFNIC